MDNLKDTDLQTFEVGEYEKWKHCLLPFKYEKDGHLVEFAKKDPIYAVKYKIKGTSAFMCPCCFNIFFKKIHGQGSVVTEIDDESEIDEDGDLRDFMSIDVYPAMTCKDCLEPLVQIDPNIAEAIQLLNLKGYTTRFCCESHKYKSEIADAYIMFNNFDLMNLVFDDADIPYGWYLDLDCYRKGDYVIRADYDESKDYLFELLKFAKSLPNSIILKFKKLPNVDLLNYVINHPSVFDMPTPGEKRNTNIFIDETNYGKEFYHEGISESSDDES